MPPLDEDGLVRLAEAERAALVAFARRRLGDRPDEAEDAVQEGLVRALRAVRKGARPTNGRAWLFTIVAHCCADARSTASRRGTVPVPDGRDLVDGGPSVARMAETRAEVAATVRAIAALPEAQRQALVAYELNGETYEELGARHGWSVGATKSLLWRARSRLVEQRAGWAAVGGAPLAAFRTLLGHADRPAALLAAPWSAEALGCATVAALGTAAIGLPASAPPASAAPGPAALHAAPHPRGASQRAAAVRRAAAEAARRRAVADARRDAAARRAAALREPARSGDARAVVLACRAGAPLGGRFTAAALLRAARELPADAAEYSGCAASIDRTLVRGG